MDSPVPSIKVANHADAIGIRGPDREMHAGRRAERDPVGTELLEDAMVIPSPKR
jgi:hypothetical protein